MKEIQIQEQKEICLEILKFADDFCRKNNLRLFLAYGSLIGAVRHKGYIPWDDDIDVMMPREDYEKLLKIFPNHPYYKLLHFGNERNYTKTFATLNDIRTYKEEFVIRKKYRIALCLNIDIFPFDNFPDNPKEQDLFIKGISYRIKRQQCITWRYTRGKTIISTILKTLGITYMRTLEFFGITSVRKQFEEYNKYIQQYNKTRTSFCGCGEDIYSNNILLPSDIFDESLESNFEGFRFRIPKKYDIILSSQYGDYMKLPPVELRVPHHLCKCYWR